MEVLNKIKELLDNNQTEEAIVLGESIISLSATPDDRTHYLLGNAYRKKSDWQRALNNYLAAMEINPQSPAKEAYTLTMQILNFYNKDMYNQ